MGKIFNKLLKTVINHYKIVLIVSNILLPKSFSIY